MYSANAFGLRYAILVTVTSYHRSSGIDSERSIPRVTCGYIPAAVPQVENEVVEERHV